MSDIISEIISEENQSPSSSNIEKRLETPSIEKEERRSVSLKEKSISPPSSKEKQKFTPLEAINEFYRLKNKYESLYYEKYIKPIIKSKKSKREKRVDFSRLPKHECVNCKRNVGTIFNISLDKTEFIRKFMVKCGDLTDPCPLDIQINYAHREQINTSINGGLKEIEGLKLKIIKEKNNALFFDDKVVSIFEDITAKLKRETENTGFLIESNILKNNNPEKRIILRKMIDDFGNENIIPFKEMVNDYVDTNNELKLNQAMHFYINEMLPKLKDILSLKYNVNYVEYEENYDTSSFISDVYRLIQIPNSLENTEFCIDTDDSVIQFIMGVKSKKSKTMKLGESKSMEKSKTKKTRKIKPIGELVIEEEEEIEIIPREGEDDEREMVSKLEREEDSIPNFSGHEGVFWNNDKYNQLWKRLPMKLKEILLTDKEWLQEYMSNCVKSKDQKQPCKLFLPKQTQLPPQKMKDDTYDFGIEIINKLFNKLGETHKNTMLTLHIEKNGVTDYNMLREALIELLEKEISTNSIYTKGYF